MSIDFYLELSKLDSDDDISDNLCLITGEPLTNRHVKMACGHMFNYVPLFHDIRNHKTKFNALESVAGALRLNEIRCPYCRAVQTEVLPYYDDMGLSMINGVNLYDPKKNVNGEYIYCQYIEQNPDATETIACQCYGSKIQIVGNPNGNDWGDTKSYCPSHKKIVVRKYKAEIAAKLKAEAKSAKLAAKLESKMKIEKCTTILKSGANKGKECGCAAIADNKCKRHSEK